MSVFLAIPVGVFSFLGIVLNIFFVICVLRDLETRFKQPLLLLIYSILGCNGLLQTVLLLRSFTLFLPDSVVQVCAAIVHGVMVYTTLASMTSCEWLGIFYYTKIVPNQGPFFIWMRRNMKMIVYCGLSFDMTFLLWDSYALCEIRRENLFVRSFNDTTNSGMLSFLRVYHFIHIFYLLGFVATMALSWGATLVYLHRHMKNMARSNSSFSSLQHQSQMRVTNMGIAQTTLYVLCSLWMVIVSMSMQFQIYSKIMDTLYDVVFSIFSVGTTVNLGFGQPIFRENIVHIFMRGKQMVSKICT